MLQNASVVSVYKPSWARLGENLTILLNYKSTTLHLFTHTPFLNHHSSMRRQPSILALLLPLLSSALVTAASGDHAIHSISPRSGPTGTRISIDGVGLVDVLAVRIGAQACGDVSVSALAVQVRRGRGESEEETCEFVRVNSVGTETTYA